MLKFLTCRTVTTWTVIRRLFHLPSPRPPQHTSCFTMLHERLSPHPSRNASCLGLFRYRWTGLRCSTPRLFHSLVSLWCALAQVKYAITWHPSRTSSLSHLRLVTRKKRWWMQQTSFRLQTRSGACVGTLTGIGREGVSGRHPRGTQSSFLMYADLLCLAQVR